MPEKSKAPKIKKIQEIVLGKGKKVDEVESLVRFAQALNCLPEIIGRKYNVYDKNQKLLYIIEQEPMNLKQFVIISRALSEIEKKDLKKDKKWPRRLKK